MTSSITCELCSQAFTSKTKLFKHLEIDHGFMNAKRKPHKIFVLFGWLSTTTKEEDKWIKDSDLNSLNVPWNATNNFIEHSLLEAIYCVDAGEGEEVLTLTERPKGSSRSSVCSQRVCHVIGSEPSNHALCDVLSYQSKYHVNDITSWITKVNRRLELTGIQVMDRITLPSTAFELNPETNCSQRVTECLLPLDFIIPPDLQVILPAVPIVRRKGWTRKADLTANGEVQSVSMMDVEFPPDTKEGQVRIAFFRQLKVLLKKFVGRGVSLHNYASGGASPDDGPSNRRIDRFYHKEIVTLRGRLWVVFSVSGDLFLKGQIARMVGAALGVMRGWLPENYIEESLRRDSIVQVPALPGFSVYLTESKYSYYEANVPVEERLDPRRRGVDQSASGTRLEQFRNKLQEHIACQYENSPRDDSGEFIWLKQFQQTCLVCASRFARLADLRSRTPSQLQRAISSLSPTPDVYRRCLELLRAADQSGEWPPSSSLRQRVIVGETLLGKGGKGGSFSVGNLPKPLPCPKGNSLFPGKHLLFIDD